MLRGVYTKDIIGISRPIFFTHKNILKDKLIITDAHNATDITIALNLMILRYVTDIFYLQSEVNF